MPELPADPAARARQVLAGYPAKTIDAAVEFVTDRSPAALDRVVYGVIAFHLPKPEQRSLDLATLPGSTKLAADLSFDSLAVVEVNFLLSDLLSINLSDAELQSLVTIDDLRMVLRKNLGLAVEL
jgi:acyl carrier protein